MSIFDQLKKHPITQPDSAYLAAHRFPDGNGFPPSYIDFATHLGWGKLCGLFLIYVPLGQHPDSWTVRSPWIKQAMDDFYEEMEHDPFLLEPDGYEGIEYSLIPFAMSENGEYLVWNLAHRQPNNELPIYILAARMGGIRYGAPDLYHFVEGCKNSEAIKTMLGPSYTKLPLTFEPLLLAL
ncbi:SMI1/KNR4 family protein [Hymenobacter cellulosivorans]|uniref:SMI1/KNR4 family protein n=1 Tax=Hymenobacter cellulosivorans TaxID=2932249 RepID=A0ABY4FGL5_9BACT|nr:SMI1/KNR4 family protein [Hymenobacter cellulosivorans]UOQ55550.1 SMI1/KNR4 family protein [Hymenobacter cellulosivorans]